MVEIDIKGQELLLDLAEQVVRESVIGHELEFDLDLSHQDPILLKNGACFVTLEYNGELRGCIGSLIPTQPLYKDVVSNAYNAAFRDPRFPPLRPTEINGLTLSISVLGVPEQLRCDSETHLLATLHKGEDGLILHDDGHRATFLPSVWEHLPEPAQFVRQLKLKAGLPADYWSSSIQWQRYHTQQFSRRI